MITELQYSTLYHCSRWYRQTYESEKRTWRTVVQLKHRNCFGRSISKYCNAYKISTTKCWQLTTTWDPDTFPFTMFCKKKYGSAVVVVLSFAARARDRELDRTSVRWQHVLLPAPRCCLLVLVTVFTTRALVFTRCLLGVGTVVPIT